jgi:hypothetical protein
VAQKIIDHTIGLVEERQLFIEKMVLKERQLGEGEKEINHPRNWKNGVGGCKAQTFREHSSEEPFTYLIDWNYDPEAVLPESVKNLFMAFVGRNKLPLEIPQGAFRWTLEAH